MIPADLPDDVKISIHALLAESDPPQKLACKPRLISIHALLAESDQVVNVEQDTIEKFLSTLSLRRATVFSAGSKIAFFLFLSTLSLRRATEKLQNDYNALLFLSTLSLRRATAKVHKTVGYFCAYETNFMGIASSC